MAAAVHSVADNHPHVVLVQEDTEDQVPAVAVPAVAVVSAAAEQDAEPDTDLAEAGNVPVAVE